MPYILWAIPFHISLPLQWMPCEIRLDDVVEEHERGERRGEHDDRSRQRLVVFASNGVDARDENDARRRRPELTRLG